MTKRSAANLKNVVLLRHKSVIGLLVEVLVTALFSGLLSGQADAQADASYRGYNSTPATLSAGSELPGRAVSSMDLLELRDFRGVAISPDGQLVAFLVSRADYRSNNYQTGLFVEPTSGDRRPIALGSAGSPHWSPGGEWLAEAPQWTPDSRTILYRANLTGSFQIWLWSANGRDRRQLTHSATGIDSYRLLPDGRTIIYRTSLSPDRSAKSRLQTAGILYDGYLRSWTSKPVIDLVLERTPPSIETWRIDLRTGIEWRLAPSDPLQDDWHLLLGNRMWSRDARNGVFNSILSAKRSPSGRLAAFTTVIADRKTSPWLASDLYIKDIRHGWPARLVARNHEFVDFWWSPGADKLYYVVNDASGRSQQLFSFAIDDKSSTLILKAPLGSAFEQFSVDASGRHVAALREDNVTPPQLISVDLRAGRTASLLNANPEFDRLEHSQAERLEWTNRLGGKAFGYLVKLGSRPGRKYPLVITTYRSGDGFFRGATGDEYPIDVFAAHGFAVLAYDVGALANPEKGDFQSAMMRWRTPLADIEAIVDRLVTDGLIDRRRVGICGLSYGSEIVEYSIGHSSLFSAAIASGAGSRDPFFFNIAGTEWQKAFANWGLGGWPEGSSERRWRQLALTMNADKVSAPFLINAPDSEYISTLPVVTALNQLNKPVELFIYADEKHIKEQPMHRYEIYETNVDWFDFWLNGHEDPASGKREQYVRWERLCDLQAKENPARPTFCVHTGSH